MSEPQGPPPAYSQPPPQGMYPNQPYQTGYMAPPPQQQQQQQTNTTTIITTQPTTAIVPGGCICGGMISENFTVCGILLAICFFPLGVLCCFLMMEKRCNRCGRVF